jgi:uncharacterized small protein (DUF1192 family)
VDEENDMSRSKLGADDAASLLATEDLAPLSQSELGWRMKLLEIEMVRVKNHRDKAAAHMVEADALFGKKSD